MSFIRIFLDLTSLLSKIFQRLSNPLPKRSKMILSKPQGHISAYSAEIRPRLLQDFLIFHLERGTFKDKLCWVDRTQKIFKIFWRHQSSSRFSPDEDSCVFKSWACMKNLWDPTDEKALSKAKQRLRAALLKLRSVQYQDREGESRIYKIVSDKEIDLQERPRKERNSFRSIENIPSFKQHEDSELSLYYQEKNPPCTFTEEKPLIFPREISGINIFYGQSLEEISPEFFTHLNFSVPMDFMAEEELESDSFIDKLLSSQTFI